MSSINTPEEVMAAEQEPGAVFLDVRGEDEVKAESLQARPFKQARCTLDDCSELMSKAETLMPNKNGEISTNAYLYRILMSVKCSLFFHKLTHFCFFSVVSQTNTI